MTEPFIPVAVPSLTGRERDYVLECMDSTWISSAGEFVDRFEEEFARFAGVENAIACSNGTVALHLALLASGIKAGDEVLVPDLTFVATANAVTYCGAHPVFVDSDAETWNLDVSLAAELVSERTKAILPVHLYGLPAEMDKVRRLAEEFDLAVIEDAAEAHGAEFRGDRAGGLGDVGTFSFYGNKIITTGEGGMVTTNDAGIADRVRLLHGQGMDPQRRYWFVETGYNYRLTNLAAAIGCAQLERVEWHIKRREEVAASYRQHLQDVPWLRWQKEVADARHVWWMFTVLLDDGLRVSRDDVMARMLERGIETRPVFPPMHVLPIFKKTSEATRYPIAADIGRRGVTLPTWAGLTEIQIQRICETLVEVVTE